MVSNLLITSSRNVGKSIPSAIGGMFLIDSKSVKTIWKPSWRFAKSVWLAGGFVIIVRKDEKVGRYGRIRCC